MLYLKPIDNNRFSQELNSGGGDSQDFIKKVSEGVQLAFQDQEGNSLAKLIAIQLKKEIDNQKRREEKFAQKSEIFEQTELAFRCRACLKYRNSPDRPKNIRKFYKGDFGVIKKEGPDWRIDHFLDGHLSSPLHVWCSNHLKRIESSRAEEETKEKEASEAVVRNALFTMKNCRSSCDFTRLQSLSSQNPRLKPYTATKNDSRAIFFEIREMAYEKLRKIIFQIFEDVLTINVSLDKITLDGRTFTALVTFFWHLGRLKCVLNDLLVMTSGMVED